MDFRTYQKFALRTKAAQMSDWAGATSGVDVDRYHAGLGLITELGECLDACKKALFYNKPFDWINAAEEVGDAFWYYAIYESTFPETGYHDTGVFQSLSTFDKLVDEPDDENPELIRVVVYQQLAVVALDHSISLMNILASDEPISDASIVSSLARSLNNLALSTGVPKSRIFESNIAKLAARYGDKFTDVGANVRRLDKERDILERGLGG